MKTTEQPKATEPTKPIEQTKALEQPDFIIESLIPSFIKEEHTRLYDIANKTKANLSENPEKWVSLIKAIDLFIDSLIPYSAMLEDNYHNDDYLWLEKAINEWQYAYQYILIEPRNIVKDIDLFKRPIDAAIPRKRSRISDDEILSGLEKRSYEVGQHRKLQEARRKLAELEARKSRIHLEIPSTPEQEKEDWYRANVYLALNVIEDGLPDFVYQLESKSYERLENVFINTLKQCSAYHIWEERRGESVPLSENTNDYIIACSQLNQKMYDQYLKSPISDFRNIYTYLIEKYILKDGDKYHFNLKYKLISAKARKIWEFKLRKGSDDSSDIRNWDEAEQYSKSFYDNVINAVGGRKENLKRVLKAFRNEGSKYNIISCFEAAIAIYFFDSKLIKECCEEEGWNKFDIL